MDAARKTYLLSLTQFPQMTVNESAIARQWLAAHADEFDDVDFNVRLGNSIDLGPGFDATIQAQAALLSQKRADMVATRGNDATIVEVKIRIALAALGQLLGYGVLYRAENPSAGEISLVAIGHDALVDVPEVFAAHGVSVETYPNLALAFFPPG